MTDTKMTPEQVEGFLLAGASSDRRSCVAMADCVKRMREVLLYTRDRSRDLPDGYLRGFVQEIHQRASDALQEPDHD